MFRYPLTEQQQGLEKNFNTSVRGKVAQHEEKLGLPKLTMLRRLVGGIRYNHPKVWSGAPTQPTGRWLQVASDYKVQVATHRQIKNFILICSQL